MSDDKTTIFTPDISWSRSDAYRTIFSNFFGTRVGNGEITIVFSKVGQNPGLGTGNIIEEQAEVVMAWTQLKMFAENLSTTVRAIEKEVGTIPTPNVFATNLEQMRNIIRNLNLSRPAPDAPKTSSQGEGRD